MVKHYIIFLAIVFLLSACETEVAKQTPENTSATNSSEQQTDWSSIRLQRRTDIEKYLMQHQTAYRWFADFPLGINDGVPFIILKLLPEVAPELWGSKNNFLDVVGLFNDQRLKNYPIARGIGWSGMARDPQHKSVDYSSFTCGACHIGRVKTDSGFQYIDGGINSHFNLPQYRVRALKTLEKISNNTVNQQEKVIKIRTIFLAVLEKVHGRDPHYFYQNYTLGDKHFDAAYEAQQVALFKDNAADLVANFVGRTELEYKAYAALLEKNYGGFEAPMLDGFGGMADATGISTSFAYIVRRDVDKDPEANPETDLPPSQGMTDFMVVWEQGKRKTSWADDHSLLINGGGQWNGNIPIPMFRNMAAELTMGFGAKTDIRVAAFAETLLENLPAPAYPFDVNLEQAAKGEALFKENCQTCHRPHNGQVYKNMGTDTGRALVASETITESGRRGFTEICPPDREVDMPGLGSVKPCAEFNGVSLVGKADMAMMDPGKHLGYNALPLGGIWAQAPYLHNGSVPTIYHLLMPNERPSIFVKSSLDYDQNLLGFTWQQGQSDKGYSYLFDTSAIKAFSNAGHDKDITLDGKVHKLDWSDNKPAVMAIIEYMKTM